MARAFMGGAQDRRQSVFLGTTLGRYEDEPAPLGESGRGPDGFRDSHEQALAAHRIAAHRIAAHRVAPHRVASRRVASRLRQQVTHYDDVALEAALLTDTRTVRRFVERELGPLAHLDQ